MSKRRELYFQKSRLEGDTMTSTDIVHWLNKEMQGALKLGLPLVGRISWPNPAAADPPELIRTLDETDLKRAIDRAHRRGVASGSIVAVRDAVKSRRQAGEDRTWITDFIDILDSLPAGNQPVSRP